MIVGSFSEGWRCTHYLREMVGRIDVWIFSAGMVIRIGEM